jgi:hypothetical protein
MKFSINFFKFVGMEKVFIILFVILAITASFLFKRYKGNSREGVIIRVCWFLAMSTIFFAFLSHNFNIAQNIAVGFFVGAGLVYFLNKLKSLKKDSDHYISNNHRHSSEI